MTDEQRRQTGWIGVPKWEVILGWALRSKTVKSRNDRPTQFVFLLMAFFVGTLGPMVFAQEAPHLVQELAGQQIPIKEIVKNNDIIVAKLDYPAGGPNVAGQMMAHKNTVFRKLAEEFPESTTIRIEVYEDGELVFPFVGETGKIEDYLNEIPIEIETYTESEVDVADPIPFPPEAGAVATSTAAATDTVVAPATTFWQRVNWPLVGVLFIFSYCTLLAVVILVVKKTRPTHTDPPEDLLIESLLVLYPDGEKKTFPMPEDRMSIGRHSSNLLMLKDSKVSSFHAEILAKPDRYVVKDLKSTNGVIVNDKKVSKKTLHPGDVIKIGNTTITTS